jgi:UPF0716 family protein affecting phage T7 exclusion
MIAIGIGVFILIQLLVLVFVIGLGRAAAMGDREFERARLADRYHWSGAHEYAESSDERQLSPDTRPASPLSSPVRIHHR